MTTVYCVNLTFSDLYSPFYFSFFRPFPHGVQNLNGLLLITSNLAKSALKNQMKTTSEIQGKAKSD